MSHPNHGDTLAVWGGVGGQLTTGASRSEKQEKMYNNNA